MSLSSDVITNCVGNIDAVQSKCVFKWEIYNFSNFFTMKPGELIRSKKFTIAGVNYSCQWELILYPMAHGVEDEEYLSLFLKSLDTLEIEVKYKFIILDNKNKIAHSFCPSKIKFAALNSAYGSRQFIKRSLLMDTAKGMLTDNKLSIFCEINTTSQNSDLQNSELCKQPDYSYKFEVLDNFEKLLNDEKHSDVTFIVGDRSLHAHKSVLSKRSLVFAAMFEHDMKENAENKVEINDIDYAVLKELFRFIYSGKVQKIETIAKDLLVAADKYDLGSLKIMCEECLCESLSVDVAIDYLGFADRYNVDKLKKCVKDFMAAHAKEMVEKPEFIAIGNLHADLIVEVFRALVLQNKS